MQFKFLKPNPAPMKRLTRAVVNAAIDLAAKEVKRELEASVRDWRHKPDFRIERAGDDTRKVTTDDAIFIYQDQGTRPHTIRPRRYQDQGTRPHTIRPRRKRALSWPGAAHPVRVVRHPGVKAMRYTDKVARGIAGKLLDIMNDAIRKAAP